MFKPKTAPTTTASLPFEALIERIARHPDVDGILVMGSARDDALKPESDLDLFVVLAERPAPVFMILTTVAERLAEVYFWPLIALERLIAQEGPVEAGSYEAAVAAWLHRGEIAYDRSGRLRAAQAKFAELAYTSASDAELYATWFQINYDLRQTKRMLRSTDPIYLTAVDIRLLYTGHQLFLSYFLLRGLRSSGEKNDLRYLEAHDPGYLALFRQFLAETNRERKVSILEELARITLTPLGQPWPADATAVHFEPGTVVDAATVERGLWLWAELSEP